ncbi:hypothetical protein EBS02_10250, partial [bacterium]|nr:hypothetical protein [bacterium]
MLGHFIKKILISSLVLSSTTAWSKSLSQLEEKALGEYIYRMEGPQKFSLIEFENYFLYELNRICDLSDVHLDHPLTLRIIDSNTVNAFATSGSFVFIYTGIIKQLTDVSEIMGVLCHELTHTKEHHTRRTVESRSDSNNQKMLLLATFPMVLLLPGIGELFYAMAVDQTFIQQQLFSQQMEYEADAGALELMRNAGFDGSKLISAFESLGRYQGNSMIPDHFSYYATHPLTSDRIARVKNALQTHPQFVLAIDRAQLDYTLLLSRLYQPYEKIPSTHDNYATLIETYRAGIADKDISGLLKTYPHSVMLRLDRL